MKFTHLKNEDDDARFFEVGDLVEVAAHGDKGEIVFIDYKNEKVIIEFTPAYGGGTREFSFDELTCIS
jgi:hypothetical protein